MDLPLKVIERLFDRLGATYGREFTYRYEGQDENSVKSMWAYELSGYADNLHAIGWALENLPEKAPNAIQFRNLCRIAPQKNETKMLPAPEVDPKIIAMVVSALKPPQDTPHGMKAWAYALKARHAAGERLNQYQIFCYREALLCH